ncbi:MAG: UbiA-like polyprenyltransferase [Clostridiales bacterium]|jgi:4-hydroxybenzoate polyprenyltransferase|nr:putative 4-hydroxybenzoate polyprenyltransferase [Eubacteriales bacterium]MDH7566743.1 UbiA-like polyprenyltransferase [Clostridiales bacterium]
MVLSKLRTYGELVMFSHTLFSIPFGLIAMFLAADGLPSPWITLWTLIALVSARTAANALNRVVDKDIDALNPRTAGRHFPKGLVKTSEVLLFILVCLGLLVLSAFMLNPVCVVLLPVPLFIFFVYSFTKRFTWACHIILGMACGGAPVGAWIAVTGNITWVSLILGTIVMFWVAGFDIIYGAQDVDFDREEGLYSIPSVFGVKKALIVSAVFHFLCVLLLIYVGFLARLGWIYAAGVAIGTCLLFYEHRIVSPTNLKNVTIASYSVNQVVSTVLLVFTTADIFILR